MKFKLIVLLIVLLSIFMITGLSAETRIRCASTTSTQNSGLFDYLLPIFEKETGIKVDVIAVGTGAAIEIGKRGDADVVVVHAKELELKAVEDGYFVNRHDVMYNDFVIIGPVGDPAGIKQANSAGEAFTRIADYSAIFVSRGDDSGTHKKEKSLWQEAGKKPGLDKYLETGQGMGDTLNIAYEKKAYCLADRGTYIAYCDKIDLQIITEGDERLYNPYGIIAVNPARHGHAKYSSAMAFIGWLTSVKGQKIIAEFKKSGKKLFNPLAVPSMSE